MITDRDNFPYERPSSRHQEEKKDRFLWLRNILNTIFMLGAVVGVILYFQYSHHVGTIVILFSMMFKIVECVFRFIK